MYLKSDGTPWRPIVHIEDISRAFIAVLAAPREIIHSQSFNVGQTAENYRISEIAEIVKQVVPNTKVEFAEGAGPDLRCYRQDFSKITRVLPSFKPQWTARKGAEQLYEAYKRIGLTLEEFEGPRYKRIDHIRLLPEEQAARQFPAMDITDRHNNGRIVTDNPEIRLNLENSDTMQTYSSHFNATCLFCGSPLQHTLVDLGMSPLCESYVRPEDLHSMEPFYPLHVCVCQNCYLAQLEEVVSAEAIFTEYAYFSSYADSWVQHAQDYARLMTKRFNLTQQHEVVEIASNDGYLLQHFVQLGIPNFGIEPAVNVAEAAVQRGVETIVKFFGVETAQELAAAGRQADLLLGNNVLAQVPDLNDFVAGMKILLKPGGVLTMEFPHLLRLMAENQFDTIYHEHFSYFSFLTVEKIFAAHGSRCSTSSN